MRLYSCAIAVSVRFDWPHQEAAFEEHLSFEF